MKLTDQQKQNAIAAGKDAIKNVYDNPKSKTLKWWERLIWIILAGAAASASSILTGCGHHVAASPGRTETCKHGPCLVIDKNSQTITYNQKASEPPAGNPVVIQKDK